MKINFYFIRGISREDTPFFPSSTAKDNYLSGKLVKSIETTFYYPPLNDNSIKISTDDINPNTRSVNYLSLVYGNRVYYYFITSISYINPELYEYKIEIDTVMTFYDDIYINKCMIERKHIKRYYKNAPTDTSFVINRNYIRENVGNGIYVNKSMNVVSDIKYGWYIIKLKKLRDKYFQTNITDNLNHSYIVNFGFCFVPAHEITNIFIGNADGTDTTHYTNVVSPFFRLMGAPEIEEIYWVPYNPISYYASAENTSNSLTIYKDRCDVSYFGLVTQLTDFAFNIVIPNYTYESFEGGFDYFKQNIRVTNYYYSLGITNYNFNINTNTGFNYHSYRYEPSVYDENYIIYEFGDRNYVTIFPLYEKFNNTANNLSSFTAYSIAGIDDGSIAYLVNNNSYISSYIDLCKLYIVNPDKISVPTFNDAWAEYNAANQGRWASAITSVGIDAASVLVSIITKNAAAGAAANAVMSSAKSYTKKGNLKASALRRLDKINQRTGENIGDEVFGTVASGAHQLALTAFNDYNKQHEPPSIKTSGHMSDTFNGRFRDIFIRVKLIQNIDYVAKYYMQFGNLLQELYVNNSTNNFKDYVHYVRYYFNYIKCNDMNISLTSYTSTDEMLDDLKDRFNDGIRFWNVYDLKVFKASGTLTNIEGNSLVSNMQYDNVEIDNIP